MRSGRLARAYPNLYGVWNNLKQRCVNPNNPGYKYYGGRGISVCGEWREFFPFLTWALDNGYKPDREIDRINNDGPYCPDNCRWVSRKNSANNRSSTYRITAFGETKSLHQWISDPRCVRMHPTSLRHRIEKLRWEAERAITIPVDRNGNRKEKDERSNTGQVSEK